MSVRRGISILDLLPQTTGVALQIPDSIVEQIGVLTVLDHRSTTSTGFHLHEGTLQALADVLDLDTSSWLLRIPGLTHGLPFRMAVTRGVAPNPTSEEPAPGVWTLDIEVRDVEVLLPGVKAANKSGGTGATPLTLKPVPGTAAQQQVRLVAQAVLRISGGPGVPATAMLADAPDPFDPTAPTGAVVRMTARPPNMLFGSSQFGMTLDSVVIDLSPTFTPADIEARGHGQDWQGVSYKEATFYFPPDTPLLHSLSLGTRDVIIGKPGGLQGELAVEFGETFNDVFNTRLTIKLQQPDGSEADVHETTPNPRGFALQYAIQTGVADSPRRVRAIFAVGDTEFVSGHTDLAVRGVWWKLPDGTEGNTPSTPSFQVPTEGLLRYRLRIGNPADTTSHPDLPSGVPDRQRELTEVQVSFPRQAGSPSGIGPIIDAVVGPETFNNVLHLRGPRERLAGIVLNHRGGGNVEWHLGAEGLSPMAVNVPLLDRPAAASITLPLIPRGMQSPSLTVSDANGIRRIEIELTPQGPVAIGHAQSAAPVASGQVTIMGSGAATPSTVIDTFVAKPFHLSLQHTEAPVPATLAGTQVTSPPGTLAQVEVPIPRGDGDPLPAPAPVVANSTPRVAQILYEFGSAQPAIPNSVVYPNFYPDDQVPPGLGSAATRHEPAALPMASGDLTARSKPAGNTVELQLRSWINDLGAPAGTRTYYIVGRTDDLAYRLNLAGNSTYNDGLATDRANAAKDSLIAAGVPASAIIVRRETDPFSPPAPATDSNRPSRITATGRLALPTGHVKQPAGDDKPIWNDRWTDDGMDSAQHARARDDSNRPPYRCAEIYASDSGAAPLPPPPPGDNGVPTRMLVPGPDGPPPGGLTTTNTANPPTDYRVRLRAKWDSPTVVQASDAIPTEAEALVAWKKAAVELPAAPSGTPPRIPPPPPSPPGQDYWEILLRWAYDSRTGQTEASGALSLPDGSAVVQSDALAGALAFGPAITALANPAAIVGAPALNTVLAIEILAVGAVIGELLNSGSGPDSSVDFDKFSISYKWDGAAHVSAGVDYTVDLRVNVSLAGSALVGRLRLKYKNVGLRFDGSPTGGLAGVALTYDAMSVEVVDPGTWSLGGPLGNLIRIAASRIGNGSQWMEFDLEFALDLGVVRLEGATIRVVITPFSVEFRGLTASINIPETLRGRGSVTIGDGGSFRALLAMEVIPAKLSAYGALAVDQDFVSIEVGVQLPVGIPLAQTGLGIFGFMGRFVANGTRNTDGLSNADPVQRQLDWYVRSPQLKYKRRSGQFAFGVGAVIGTMPDGAFTFNAEGTLTIGFPDISVIFGIDAHLISQRKSQATESGTANSNTFRILGMVLIEPDSVMVAVRASYEIPKVLQLQIPISAYFPLAGSGAWFIRIGTDNHPTRPGSPVTITLLPGTLDVRAWAFVLIEERELHGLGGTLVPADLNIYPLNFDGFSIGFGAGFELRWAAGPFKLEIIAFLLVGMGTKPLLFAGAAGVKGELDLVILSVGVDGVVHFHISKDLKYLKGHFCGHVDLFFFEISGCVDISIGNDVPVDVPAPESPLAGIDFCDHLSAVKGKGVAAGSTDALPTVWPDTVAVLRFQHYVEDGLGAGSDFVRLLPTPAVLSPWSGSTELKYAFKITNIALFELTGTNPAVDSDWTKVTGPFDSAWWMPTHRKAIIEGGLGAIPPSTEEGRELGLFSWDPRAWSRWLGEGGQDVPGNPANTVNTVCELSKPADPSCAFGRDRRHSTGNFGLFLATPPTDSAFPSRFNVIAHLPAGLDIGTITALASDAGWTLHPGAVVPLHGAIMHTDTLLTEGWRFPTLRERSLLRTTLPVGFTPSKPLLEGEIILEVCLERRDVVKEIGGCDKMPDKDGQLETFTGATGTKYTGPGRAFAADGERAYELIKNHFTGTFSGTINSVSIDIETRSGVCDLIAFSANGVEITRTSATGKGRQRLRIEVDGIVSIRIKSQEPAVVFLVCWGHTHSSISDLLGLPTNPQVQPPEVMAVDANGKVFVLKGEPVNTPVPQPGILVPDRCPKLRYVLPRLDGNGPGWKHVQIAPWIFGNLSLVAFCGVTLEAAQAQQQDSNYRKAFTDLLVSLVQFGTTNQPTHKVYLKADRRYEIRVHWQWQGFRPAHPGDEPGSTATGTWNDASSPDRFRFKTAPFGLAAVPAPVQNTSLDVDPAQGGPGYDERTFDPRGIARYITHEQPTHEDPPHFLNDHVGFWFMADHLEPLVEKYERILQVKVLHTRPKAGSLHAAPAHIPGSTHLLDVTESVQWAVDTRTWFDADHLLVEAAKAAPCIGGAPALGSSSVSVNAHLEPQSEYDLLLNAAPKTLNAFPEVPIARAHFRTSRYHNPTGMLRALGFESGGGLVAPVDAIATVAFPAGPLQTGDAEMDAALKAFGLDPWELPAAPRTSVIWLRPVGNSQPWRVVGVLVEADEPIFRRGFRTGSIGETEPPSRVEVKTLRLSRTWDQRIIIPHFPQPPTVTVVTRRDQLGDFTERVRSAAGTRCLFTPASPIEVKDGRLYDLELQLRENGIDGGSGRAPIFDRPAMIWQEGE